MNKLSAILAAAILCLAPAQPQAAEGPTFPGNEALRFVNGKRVVEMPPLHENQKQVVAAAKAKPRPPTDQAFNVFMIETTDGLSECTSISTWGGASCRPSSLGRVVLSRLWVVKRKGAWLTCVSRAPNARCDPIHGLEGIGARE